MENLRERVSWAIGIIKEDKSIGKEITDLDLAKLLGVAENTLNTYKAGGGKFKEFRH